MDFSDSNTMSDNTVFLHFSLKKYLKEFMFSIENGFQGHTKQIITFMFLHYKET